MTASEQMCRCGGPEFKHPNEPGPETCYLCVVLHNLDRAEAQIEGLRADLARVTGELEREREANDSLVSSLEQARIERDEYAEMIRQAWIVVDGQHAGEALAEALARIRAEARAETLEEAAQEALRVADEEMQVAEECDEVRQVREGDARRERASAAFDVAFAIRALANGKDGEG